MKHTFECRDKMSLTDIKLQPFVRGVSFHLCPGLTVNFRI